MRNLIRYSIIIIVVLSVVCLFYILPEQSPCRKTVTLCILHLRMMVPDPYVRVEAVKSCRSLNDENAVPLLIIALKDKDVSVRREAAEALKKNNDYRAVPLLLDAVNDSDSQIS